MYIVGHWHQFLLYLIAHQQLFPVYIVGHRHQLFLLYLIAHQHFNPLYITVLKADHQADLFLRRYRPDQLLQLSIKQALRPFLRRRYFKALAVFKSWSHAATWQ